MHLSAKGRFSQWSKILLVAVLCLGILFRVANLDQKVFWVDEVSTAMRVSGYTFEEVAAELVDGPVMTRSQLQKYQYPNPEKSLSDSLTSLAAEDVHPPLFFVILRAWTSWVGNSVTSLRSVAVLFSLLMLPAMWWLCRELFGTNAIGWVAVALLAVSPVQVVYAQETRQYTLWMLLILLTSASLLRSLRLNTWRSWTTYSLLMSLGLYTHYLFALVAAGHGLYTLCVERLKPTRKFLTYLLASALAGIAYLPWLIFSWQFPTDSSQLGWMNQPPGLIKMTVRVVGVLSRAFVDFGVGQMDSPTTALIVAPLLLLSMGASLLALLCLIRQTPFKTWFFIVTLGGITAAVVLGSYFVLGKMVATTRFVLPVMLSLQLALAYLLVEGFGKHSSLRNRNINRPIVWRLLFGILLSMGIVSCLLRFNAPVWWTQIPSQNQHTPAIAQTLNQQQNSLVIVDGSSGLLFFNIAQPQTLLHSINPEAQVQMQIADEEIPNLEQTSYDNLFIYRIVDELNNTESAEAAQARIASRYQVSLDPVIPGTFWRVSR